MKFLREEYKCKYVLRSAGSHSAIDVIGINIKDKKIYLIQCKPDSMSINKKKELEKENELLNDVYSCSFFVV